MIATRFQIVAALLASATLACGQQTPAPAQGEYSIHGVVVSAKTGNLLDQVIVTLSRSDDRVKITDTTTAEDGSFDFQHLQPANYTLQATRRGYNSALYDEHEGYFCGIVTGPGQNTTNLRFMLQPAAIISGVVTDDAGDPVRSAQVALYRKRSTDGSGKIAQSASQQTDDIGAFEFAGVAPDDYFVAVSATPWYAVHPEPKFDPQGHRPSLEPVSSPLDVAYPLTFYPGTTDSDDASPIPVRAGDHVQLNFSLRALPALHLRVLPEDPHDRRQFRGMEITQNVFGTQVPVNPASINGNDSGQIIGLPPGHYRVRSAGNQASELNLSADATLDPPPPAQQVKVQGEVAMADGENPPPLYLAFNSRADNLSPGVRVEKDGTFTMEAMPPGSYEVNVAGPSSAYSVVRMAAQGASVEGRMLNLGSTSANLAIVLTPASAIVKGYARQNGKAASGVMIVLVPDNPDASRELFRRDESNSDGSFLLANVAPGAYTLVAIDEGWSLEWSRPEVIARYLARGTRINITLPRETLNLATPLVPQPR